MPTPPSMTTKTSHFMKKCRKAKGSASSGTKQGKLMLPSCWQYPGAESTLSLCPAGNKDDEDNARASCFKARVREMLCGLSQTEAYTKLQVIWSSPSHYTKVSGMREDALLAFVDDMQHTVSSGAKQGKPMLQSCRHYPDAESTLSLCPAGNEDDEDNAKASCFKAKVREKLSGLFPTEAYAKLQMISSSPSHYTKVSGMRKDALLDFVDDMQHIISAKLILSVGEPRSGLRQPELSDFARNFTAMLFNLSTKEAKHQLYTILRHKERYINLSGLTEDSLTAFVYGLLQDFC
jgi:hypothetical protein